jgi:hypothetical protein
LSSYGTHKENTYFFSNELDAYLSTIGRLVLIKQEFCFGMLAKAALMPLPFVRGTNFWPRYFIAEFFSWDWDVGRFRCNLVKSDM